MSTVAVVPLDDVDVERLATDLVVSLKRLVDSCTLVTRTAAEAELGDLDTVPLGRLTSWFAVHERRSEVVVLLADPEPSPWTDLCVRQADLVLLAAPARAAPAVRPVEELIVERRVHVPARTRLVLVHPRGTRDPHGTSRWLAIRNVEHHHHVAVDQAADVDRVARLVMGRGIGIVFSGGGARGLAGIGVLRALEELAVPYDAVGGVSIGALVAGGTARATPAWRAIRASFPIPGVFPPIRAADSDLLVSDGVLDNLPVGIMRAEHPGITVITIDVRRPHDLGGEGIPGDGIVSGWRVLLDRLGPSTRERDRAGLGRILLRLTELGTELRLTELGTEPDDDPGELRIRPKVNDVGIADFGRFDQLVDRGYEAAMQALPEWLAARQIGRRSRFSRSRFHPPPAASSPSIR